MIRVVTVIVIL